MDPLADDVLQERLRVVQPLVAKRATVADVRADATEVVHEQAEARRLGVIDVADERLPCHLDDVDRRDQMQADPQAERQRRVTLDRRPTDVDVGPMAERLSRGSRVRPAADHLDVRAVGGDVLFGRDDRVPPEAHDLDFVARFGADPQGYAITWSDGDAVDVPPRPAQWNRADRFRVRAQGSSTQSFPLT